MCANVCASVCACECVYDVKCIETQFIIKSSTIIKLRPFMLVVNSLKVDSESVYMSVGVGAVLNYYYVLIQDNIYILK